jgi:hypothetical protein
MNTQIDSTSNAADRLTIGVAPLRTFTRPLGTKTYATLDDWMAAALAGTKRMATDEEFRKDIEQFIS